jgi:hypothetical protein
MLRCAAFCAAASSLEWKSALPRSRHHLPTSLPIIRFRDRLSLTTKSLFFSGKKACKEPFSYCVGITEYTLPLLS